MLAPYSEECLLVILTPTLLPEHTPKTNAAGALSLPFDNTGSCMPICDLSGQPSFTMEFNYTSKGLNYFGLQDLIGFTIIPKL